MIAQYAAGTTYFFHHDHLGSTRMLTHVDKSVDETIDYLPYGEEIGTDPRDTQYKFTGDERDSETHSPT
jgi:hypothetical protein